MKSDVLGCVCAALLGAAIVVATPAIARGGFGGGGHFGGFGPRFTGRSVAIDRFDRDHRFCFRHHRFRNFAFFGAPFFGFGAWPYTTMPMAGAGASYGPVTATSGRTSAMIMATMATSSYL
jgi:hypothetical protein